MNPLRLYDPGSYTVVLHEFYLASLSFGRIREGVMNAL